MSTGSASNATGTAASHTPIVAIVGATATGKTALAIELARRLDGEVVNADAMQFYRGLDIGTAKATAEEQAGIPHHLIDTMDLSEEASVATFQQQAREKFEDIRDRGRTPILVGGSGLYVRAALDEIEFPPTDPDVRRRLEEQAQQHGMSVLAERLARIDPESAQRLHDDRRIIRALEVHEISGRTFTSYMPQRRYRDPRTIQIGLQMERSLLHERIDVRVSRMIADGLAEETQELLSRGLAEAPTASRAIGYPQTQQFLAGKITAGQWQELIATATRQFARRQETWFRADSRVHWLAWDAPELVDHAVALIETV
ncbi:tRNA (adenosine(37)-N6)-dimethylallyltransferase MiaA [Micrococcoides hystricis]|uniref:tRNA dimethylallyltransferase n=1 Tax=Micrococcoides hystricis TaxID=1572761 RepID=A0ABV6P8L8_9MICC